MEEAGVESRVPTGQLRGGDSDMRPPLLLLLLRLPSPLSIQEQPSASSLAGHSLALLQWEEAEASSLPDPEQGELDRF